MSKSGILGLSLVLVVAATATARAADITVYAAGAVQSAVLDTKTAFETASGHRLTFVFGTVGALRDRILAGEAADATLLSVAGIEALEQKGAARKGMSVIVGSTGPGIAYRAGAPKPDVSSPEALKAALLAAKSVSYGDPTKGATAGIHFSKVLGELGIAEAIKPKTHLVPFGVEGIERVAKGESELAVSQATEILANPGTRLAGSLPAPYQIGTVYAATGVQSTKVPDAVAAYLRFLLSAETVAKFRANGFAEP